jgi:hypothetical protein
MNFVQEFEVLSRSSMKILDTYDDVALRDHSDGVKSPFDPANTSFSTSSSNQFDYLIQDVDAPTLAAGVANIDEDNCCKFVDDDVVGNSILYNRVSCISPGLIQQQNFLQSTLSNSFYANNNLITPRRASRSNSITNATLNPSTCYLNQNIKFSNEFSTSSTMNKLQYTLMAPTSPGVKINEDTLTYLNQGQNYELKLSKVSEFGMQNPLINTQFSSYLHEPDEAEDIKPVILNFKSAERDQPNSDDKKNSDLNSNQQSGNQMSSNENIVFHLSVIRICFWDRKLQEVEQDEIKEVL